MASLFIGNVECHCPTSFVCQQCARCACCVSWCLHVPGCVCALCLLVCSCCAAVSGVRCCPPCCGVRCVCVYACVFSDCVSLRVSLARLALFGTRSKCAIKNLALLLVRFGSLSPVQSSGHPRHSIPVRLLQPRLNHRSWRVGAPGERKGRWPASLRV